MNICVYGASSATLKDIMKKQKNLEEPWEKEVMAWYLGEALQE